MRLRSSVSGCCCCSSTPYVIAAEGPSWQAALQLLELGRHEPAQSRRQGSSSLAWEDADGSAAPHSLLSPLTLLPPQLLLPASLPSASLLLPPLHPASAGMRKLLLLLPSLQMPLQLSDVCRTSCTLTLSTRLGSYTTYSIPPSRKVSATLSYLYHSLRSLLSQGPALSTMRVRPRDTTHSRITPLWLALQLVACKSVARGQQQPQ